MTNQEPNNMILPGWLRYGLDGDGKKPSDSKAKKNDVPPMSEVNKVLAKSLSDELWRQRMEKGDDVSITLRGEGVEGLEKLLWALAEEDYAFANVRISQLIRGIVNDAPQWRESFDKEN
jgi:hypothetical protein